MYLFYDADILWLFRLTRVVPQRAFLGAHPPETAVKYYLSSRTFFNTVRYANNVKRQYVHNAWGTNLYMQTHTHTVPYEVY